MTDLPQTSPESLIKFAGIPDGIPVDKAQKFWGFLNKQLAFANWDDCDLLIMEEELRQLEIREMSSYTEDQLVSMDDDGVWDQVLLVSKGLMTLGKRGFLVKQSRTTSSQYEVKNNAGTSDNGKFRSLLKPKSTPEVTTQ